MTNEELLEDIRIGRDWQVAFQSLYDRQQPYLRHYLFRLVASRNDLEDAAQNCWVKVLQHRGSPRPVRHFVPWFRRLIKNEHSVIVRSQSRATKYETRVARAERITTRPEDLVHRRQLLYQCFEGLRACDPHHLVTRFYLHSQSMREIAEQMGITVDSLEYQMRQTLERLRTFAAPTFTVRVTFPEPRHNYECEPVVGYKAAIGRGEFEKERYPESTITIIPNW